MNLFEVSLCFGCSILESWQQRMICWGFHLMWTLGLSQLWHRMAGDTVPCCPLLEVLGTSCSETWFWPSIVCDFFISFLRGFGHVSSPSPSPQLTNNGAGAEGGPESSLKPRAVEAQRGLSLLMQWYRHVWLLGSAKSTRQSRKVLSWCLSGKTIGASAVCWKEGGAIYLGNQSMLIHRFPNSTYYFYWF